MDNLNALHLKLKELTKHLPDARPFLCEGSPFGCDVFLVGINPATSTNFWNYWSTESGFDKKKWIEYYKLLHGGKLKPTRQRIEIFFKTTSPLRVLETNVFASPSARESALDSKRRNTDLFDYLLQTIKPKLILAHGASAISHLSEKYKMPRLSESKGEFLNIPNSSMDIRVENHFSYQWSYLKIQELALEVKNKYA